MGVVILVGLILPQRFIMPVENATQKDYNPLTLTLGHPKWISRNDHQKADQLIYVLQLKASFL